MTDINFWRTDYMRAFICATLTCRKEGTNPDKFVIHEGKTYCVECAKSFFFPKEESNAYRENFIG